MKTFHVEVRTYVEVSLDEAKFTPEFMAEFRRDFYDFATLAEHAEHLAQLASRDAVSSFIEGYGLAKEMGISFVMRGGDQSAVEVEGDLKNV
jgi:hypothetical protein